MAGALHGFAERAGEEMDEMSRVLRPAVCPPSGLPLGAWCVSTSLCASIISADLRLPGGFHHPTSSHTEATELLRVHWEMPAGFF